MSSYWQGKGAGKRIAIRFTKPLLGDVTGNEDAFTIKGMVRSPLKYGPLVERTFAVESVERYPIAELWQDDFSGQMDGVEVGGNGVVLTRPTDDFEDNTIGNVPSGWAVQWGTGFTVQELNSQKSLRHVHTSGQRNGLRFTDAGVLSDGEIYCEIQRVTGSTPNFGLVFCLSGSGGSESAYQLVNYGTTLRLGKYVSGAFISISTAAITALNGNTWYSIKMKKDGTSLYGKLWQKGTAEPDWQVTGTDSSLSSGYVGVMAFNANSTVYYDNFAINEYSTPGTYTTATPTDTLPADPRLRFEANTPEDTTVTVEYACTADDETPPETWMSVDDEDLLTIDDAYLWLRYTLETEDTSKTPTLLAVWLEEAEAPPGTILLTMAPDSRFNDVEGDLTISYEREKGTLTGTRPVEDFTESFTPTGLEPTPINVQGTITAGIEVEVDFIEVYYVDLGHKNTITAGITVEVDLIPVSEIPP